MNEERYRQILCFSGKTEDEIEENWAQLLEQLRTLLNRVKPFYRQDIMAEILKQIGVLERNKPTKKVYKSVKKRVGELWNVVEDLGGRAR